MPRRDPLTYAAYLLRNRLRSRAEIERKLREKRYEQDEIGTTLARLQEIGLLDDSRFAKSYASDKLTFSRRGKFRISLELLKKGVNKDTINDAVEGITIEDELKIARELTSARLKQWRELDELAQLRRLVALLQRRGFASAVVRQIIQDFKKTTEG